MRFIKLPYLDACVGAHVQIDVATSIQEVFALNLHSLKKNKSLAATIQFQNYHWSDEIDIYQFAWPTKKSGSENSFDHGETNEQHNQE